MTEYQFVETVLKAYIDFYQIEKPLRFLGLATFSKDFYIIAQFSNFEVLFPLTINKETIRQVVKDINEQ